MRQIIFFFIRNKNFLLFIFLFILSISLTINSHSFHKNKFVNSANFLSGRIYTIKSNITDYFDLEYQNEILLEENKILRNKLGNKLKEPYGLVIDSSAISNKYIYSSARVINNTYSKTKNNITINKGSKDGLTIDLGIITSEGIVGIINHVSKNYATIQSVINTNSQINAKLKKSSHFGFLVWDTKDPNIVQLTDIPRLAQLAVGDTVVTDGKSTIFPEGIPIGIVEDFILKANTDYYNLNIRLFNDMTSLNHVYIIKNLEAEEIKALEKVAEDEE